MLSTAEQTVTLQEYKEGLETLLYICFCQLPPEGGIEDINKVYNIIHSQDKSIEYLKEDIDTINQGKTIFESDTREFTDEEINRVIKYIKNHNSFNQPVEDKNVIKKLYEKLIKLRPEHEKELAPYVKKMFIKYIY